jgi:hypothetical protein
MKNRIMFAIALALLLGTLQAAGQWAWRDESGRMVFSDQPPPVSIKADRIVRQPAPSPAASKAGESTAPSMESGKTAVPPSHAAMPKEADPSAIRPQPAQEKADAEGTAADLRARAQREQDCERMRRYLLALDSGQRIAIPDAQGTPIVIDDATRASEISLVRKRLEACN